MSPDSALPPGQYAIDEFPRFGLPQFAGRFPHDVNRIELRIGGDVEVPATISRELAGLRRVEQECDFHCVTTWSRLSVRWSGFRFSDFFEQIVVPRSRPVDNPRFVVLRGQDDYRSSLPLDDLLADDVLLADTINGGHWRSTTGRRCG